MKNNIIEINNLNYKNIFNNFNISFENNKFISISGPNNCGKTTLLRILSEKILTVNDIKVLNQQQMNYNQYELGKILSIVSEEDIHFTIDQVESELQYYANQNEKLTTDKYKAIIKGLKLSKLLKENPNNLNTSEQIKVLLAKSLLKEPRILLIDDIDTIIPKKEMHEIMAFLGQYKTSKSITIIISLSNLDYSLYTDELIIFEESQIILDGKPIEILQKDNIINKAGLQLPFMMDLSVKLRDYDLLKDIELDPDRMVDLLWK